MPSRLAMLLLAAAVLGCAHASRELLSDEDVLSGRQLLQVPNATDCDRSVKHCAECRYQFYKGTVTKAICTRCEVGYAVKNSGRACFCAPGYYTQEADPASKAPNVGFTCDKCDYNYYCPGAKITAVSSKVRISCGANKITTTEYAKSDRECVVKPGFGWAPGEDSVECPVGFYNPGYNTRKCTKCPGSLTTHGTNSNSTQDCVAPIGYYYLRGKAVACARGTYKSYKGNNDCDECPTGMTTAAGAVANDAKTDCEVVLPGYSLKATPALGDDAAVECGQDSYRVEEVTVTGSSGATNCDACGNNMVTLPNVTRATSPDACLVPPGYGWVAAVAPDTKGQASICLRGLYNPGYNREPCIDCGNGTITTEAQGSTSADQCYTPAGDGNRRDPISGVLEGYTCEANTYGRPNNTYGLVDVECTKCLEHTHTVGTGSTSAEQCLTDAGYGWDNGQVNQCDFGYWNAGENQNKCTYCGDFFNTTNDGPTAANGERGMSSGDTCKLDLGYQPGAVSNTAEPCLRGWYKALVGNVSCTQCPAGTSTTITMASVARTDCDVCRPGFGVDGGSIDLADPYCHICQSGTYSAGFTRGGQDCGACPKTQNFTGTMVSRQGAWSPEECFGEFITDDTNAQNFLWWDIIATNDSVSGLPTLVYKNLLTSLQTCQSGCAGNDNCQYFEFYTTGAPSGVDNSCYWRDAGDIKLNGSRIGGDKTAAWWNVPTGIAGIVMFEIREGSYVVYPKTATEVIGTTLTLSGASSTDFKATRTACDKAPDCIGLTWDSTTGWRAFKGALWEDAVGKVRVVGNAINSWVGIPTGLEEPENWTP